MEVLPGFVSVPRLAGSPRPAGAFFSAEVVGTAGPGAWRVRLEGRLQTVRSDVPLVPGQLLRLRNLGMDHGRWLLQVLAPAAQDLSAAGGALAAAFLARGLPAAGAALDQWKGRLVRGSQAESWAAELAARGSGPADPLADALQPWLTWAAGLEQGRSDPPPDDGDFWDLWNARQPPKGAPWVAMPLRWEHEGQPDAGLLRARWQESRQAFDFWSLTAAPAGVGFRLDAEVLPRGLNLTWRLFDEVRLRELRPLAAGWAEALSDPDFRVNLRLVGRSVDVQA